MGAREFGDRLLQRLLGHVVDQLPGSTGVGLSVVEGSGPHSVSAVGVAAVLDPVQWACGTGPLVDALRREEVEGAATLVLPGDDAGSGPDRWPALAEALRESGTPWPAGAVICAGEGGDQLTVIVSCYAETAATAELAEQLDRFAGLLTDALALVEHCAGEERRAEQMVQMVQYRRVIEQAKGLVMAATGADAAAAFTTLARASQHFNLRLRNLAVALVEHVGGSRAEGPEDPEQVVVPSSTDRRTAVQVWAALTRPGPIQRPTEHPPQRPTEPPAVSPPA